MLARIRTSMDEKDQGFTLIELLVVMIIIGILAAIAIPVFLNQREKGWDSAIKSDLKNAATAQETVLTETGEYTDVVADLQAAGFNYSADTNYAATTQEIRITIDAANPSSDYCIEATSAAVDGTQTWAYDSALGGLQGAGSTC